MKDTNIEWCDHTFNPWIGCTKVSPGCANCFAETLMDTRYGRVKWGKGQPRSRTAVANWNQVRKWNRIEDAKMVSHEEFVSSRRPRVFCASLADWLDDEVPIEWFIDLLDLIRTTPNLDWLLLTKRPQNWNSRLEEVLRTIPTTGISLAIAALRCRVQVMLNGWANSSYVAPEVGIENYWIGVTAEDQPRADERLAHLAEIPASVKFVSAEPLIGPVILSGSTADNTWNWLDPKHPRGVHWVICGGESGHNARPMHPDWARSLRDQCAEAGVPFLFKQWGEWVTCDRGNCEKPLAFIEKDGTDSTEWTIDRHSADSTAMMARVGKKTAGRLLDGVEHNGFPEARS